MDPSDFCPGCNRTRCACPDPSQVEAWEARQANEAAQRARWERAASRAAFLFRVGRRTERALAPDGPPRSLALAGYDADFDLPF